MNAAALPVSSPTTGVMGNPAPITPVAKGTAEGGVLVGRCKKVNIGCRMVDDDAWKYVQELMKHPEDIEEWLAEIEKQLTKTSVDLTPIDNHLVEIDRQERNLALAIAQSKDPAYMRNLVDQEAERLKIERRDAEKLRAQLTRDVGNADKVREMIDRFRSKWLNHQSKIQGEATYMEKREAVLILGLRATIYSASHEKRYTFTIVPPEIEFLKSLSRALRRPRPSCVLVPVE